MAKAANSNNYKCSCNVRPVSGDKIDRLLAELTAIKPRATVYEPPLLRMAGLRPSPAWRKMITSQS